MTKGNNVYYEIAKLRSKKCLFYHQTFGRILSGCGMCFGAGTIKDIRHSSFDAIKIQSDPSTKRTLFVETTHSSEGHENGLISSSVY